jgi:hypothetical protein
MTRHFDFLAPPKEIQGVIGAYGLSSRIEKGGVFAAWIIADKSAPSGV